MIIFWMYSTILLLELYFSAFKNGAVHEQWLDEATSGYK